MSDPIKDRKRNCISDQLEALASHRRFFRNLGLGAALFAVPGAFAEELTRKTAWVEEGPSYPPNTLLAWGNVVSASLSVNGQRRRAWNGGTTGRNCGLHSHRQFTICDPRSDSSGEIFFG